MGFERYHPAVNRICFAAVIAGTVAFQKPVFLMLSFLCACSYSIRRNRGKAVIFDLCLLPLAGAFVLYYSSFHHFGITVLDQKRGPDLFHAHYLDRRFSDHCPGVCCRGRTAVSIYRYDPRLTWKPIQLLTILFYAGYTVLGLMPLGLELWTEYQF